MSHLNENDFPSYLDEQLTERGWTVAQFAERAGLAPSVVFRWRKGYRPNIENSRIVARTLGVPILEVLIVSGWLTHDEAQAQATTPPSVSDLDTVELTRELNRRAEAEHKCRRQVNPQQAIGTLLKRWLDQLDQPAVTAQAIGGQQAEQLDDENMGKRGTSRSGTKLTLLANDADGNPIGAYPVDAGDIHLPDTVRHVRSDDRRNIVADS